MRRQNPPQANLDRAQEWQDKIDRKFFRLPLFALGALPSLIGGASFILFLIFRSTIILYTTLLFLTIAIAFGFVIIFFEVTNWRHLNEKLRENVVAWRRPYELPPFLYTFYPRLNLSDVVIVDVSYFTTNQSDHTQGRLKLAVQAALAKDFATRRSIPTFDEVQAVIDAATDPVADDLKLPVCYTEILSMRAEQLSSQSEDVEIGDTLP